MSQIMILLDMTDMTYMTHLTSSFFKAAKISVNRLPAKCEKIHLEIRQKSTILTQVNSKI